MKQALWGERVAWTSLDWLRDKLNANGRRREEKKSIKIYLIKFLYRMVTGLLVLSFVVFTVP